MELSWYRGPNLSAGHDEPPFLTNENIRAGGVYSVDGPDGIGDQYFEGLEVLRKTQATWLVARSFPTEVEEFLRLPIAAVRILEFCAAGATVRVEAIDSVGTWMREAVLGEEDGFRSVHRDVRAQNPLPRAIRFWSASKPHLWVRTTSPLNAQDALGAVLSMPSGESRRILIVTWTAECCYLVHDR